MRRTNLSTLSASDPTHRSADLGLARRALDAIGGVSSGRVGAVADSRDAERQGAFGLDRLRRVSRRRDSVGDVTERTPGLRGAAIEQALGAPPRVATRADEFLERL